jgi:hypothetical protein
MHTVWFTWKVRSSSRQTWEKDGVKHYKTIINAKSVQFLDKNGDQARQPEVEELPAESNWE